MQRLITSAMAVWFISSAPALFARAYFAGAQEMVQGSVAIAILDISKVEAVDAKGEHWTYRERAQATVDRTLKGSLPQHVQLFGNETFICEQVRFQPGRYLAFLRKDGEKLVGANWHLSVRPIKDGQVEWYSGKQRLDLSWQPLSVVVEQVRDLMKQSAKISGSP
jgi:hypothetical protein